MVTKIPMFKVSIFRGNTIDRDEYIKSNLQVEYDVAIFEDPSHCNNTPYWSGAFVSRLCESIEEIDILSFLDTELDGENNCARVRTRIEKHVLSKDINTARVMTNWSSLLSSK